MRAGPSILLLPTFAAMELCWMFAMFRFSLSVLTQRTFPLAAAAFCYAAALGLTMVIEGRGLRRIWVLGLHLLAGYLCVAVSLGLAFFHSAVAFNPLGVGDRIAQMPQIDRCALVIMGLGLTICWIKGRLPARTRLTHRVVCRRFDGGLTAFGALFLIHFLIQVKGGTPGPERGWIGLWGAFLSIGLTAVGLARNFVRPSTAFINRFGAMGMVTASAILVILLGAAVMSQMPSLNRSAVAGYAVFKETVSPLGSVLARSLKSLLAYSRSRRYDPPRAADDPGVGGGPTESVGEAKPWKTVFAWGVLGAVGLFAVMGMAILVLYGICRLLGRSPKREPGLLALDHLWLRLVALGKYLWQMVRRKKPRNRKDLAAGQLFAALANWGRRSGLPRFSGETPWEYAQRLARQFPALGPQVDIILESVQRQAYGGMPMERHQVEQTRLAWRRLTSPRHWPVRVRRLFSQPFTSKPLQERQADRNAAVVSQAIQ